MLKVFLVFLFSMNVFAEVNCQSDADCPMMRTPVGVGCLMVKKEEIEEGEMACEEKCVEKMRVRALCVKAAGATQGSCVNPVRNPLDFNTSDPEVCAYAMTEKKADYVFNI